jgi:hypothetical protein
MLWLDAVIAAYFCRHVRNKEAGLADKSEYWHTLTWMAPMIWQSLSLWYLSWLEIRRKPAGISLTFSGGKKKFGQ